MTTTNELFANASPPSDPAPLRPGVYRAVALEAYFGYAGTGTQQIGVLLEVSEGPSKGWQVVWYGYFSEASAARTFDSLKALGWTGADIATVVNDITTSGKAASIKLKEETYQGETKLKVDRVGDPTKVDGVAMKEKIDADDPRMGAFANELSGMLMAYQAKSSQIDQGPGGRGLIGAPGLRIGPAPALRPSTAPGPMTPGGPMSGTPAGTSDDDIPF